MRLLLSLVLAGGPLMASSIGFAVHNLVSNQPGAVVTDSKLVNAWGLAASGGSPFWINANGSGLSLVYNANTLASLIPNGVGIPGEGSVTGVSFNPAAGAGNFNGDAFLFDSEDGTVSGWRGSLGGTAETLALANSSNVYKGLTIASTGGFTYAYLANFRAGTIDVMKGLPAAPDLAGHFTDPALPAGYAPFNVQVIGSSIYVAYALQDASKKDEQAGAGLGFLSQFDLNGNFVRRVTGGGPLNAPWGLALAPASFGDLGGLLLVGNSGDGRINAYDPLSGNFVQTMQGPGGNPISIDGLWALRFGNGGAAGPTGKLFFTAGPDDESNGLFGSIESAPEPATWTLAAAGLLLTLGRLRRRKA